MSKSWFFAALVLIVLISAAVILYKRRHNAFVPAVALLVGLIFLVALTFWMQAPPLPLPAPTQPLPAPTQPLPPSRERYGRGESGKPEGIVTASRVFAGPGQYPPSEFAAYGILAFRSRSSSYDRDRHLMICNSYLATLPHASELDVPHAEQMVTVWPLNSKLYASTLNSVRVIKNSTFSPENICPMAVDNYGLVTAQSALKDAELAGADTSGTGPLLLAWSPSTDKGKPDALVLVSDLSYVTTYEQAQEVFVAWSRDIERDPTLWNRGWNKELLRSKIRYWADKYGSKSLALFGVR